MLEIKKISKSYTTGNFTQKALDEVSISFRKSEFVCILGPSGSGKTTLLNIISGLDHYDSGDLVINNISTKKFKDKDWDAYRNNCIGFVFQNYNLISHINILNNVEMGMTLSGISKKEKRAKALEVLDKVGLKRHAYKKPNQLSGGQMQRVAIARALANNPDIILADEPTGALDSKTSKQIMDLILEIAKDKLVIMVTHNSKLANDYATRTIELQDGKIINDSSPIKNEINESKYKLKRTAMNYLTALSLSFNNIKTKKGRTILTAFACSIGIIGISVILSLSNGFDNQIDIFERDTLTSLPIMISKASMSTDKEDYNFMMKQSDDKKEEKPDYIIPYNVSENTIVHINKIDNNYKKYIEKIDPKLVEGIMFVRLTGVNLVRKIDNETKPINSNNISLQTLTTDESNVNGNYLENNFDLIAGSFPKEDNELILQVDSKNRINTAILDALGIKYNKKIEYESMLGLETYWVSNNDYYQKYTNMYGVNLDFNSMLKKENTKKLTIVGIVRTRDDDKLAQAGEMSGMGLIGSILCQNNLMEEIININSNSDIVKAQKNSNLNVLTGEVISDNETKEQLLLYLGAEDIPYNTMIFPLDFDSKADILSYLDKYNEGKKEEDQVIYTDMASSIVEMSSGIMDAITYVLIAFSGVSLLVSSIMIGIITYISVLERTKEIGILRSLGARKKDITRVFNAETTIIGFSSGLLGLVIARLLLFPINSLLYNLTDLKNVAILNPLHALIMLIISIVITLIGGFIPAKIAAKKNPVEALRTE